jgi:glycosyltransferase involved in cell wall biosynthesis
VRSMRSDGSESRGSTESVPTPGPPAPTASPATARSSTDPGRPEPPLPVPGSCLVSAFPYVSGHGRAAELWRDLGVFQETALFKIRRHDSEAGYGTVVKDVFRLGAPAAFLSIYLPSSWGRYVRRRDLVHFMSPHFFPLVRYNPHATGTVHDLIFLDRSTHNHRDTPAGARIFFPRVMRFAERLRGVVSISHSVDRQLHAQFPRVRSKVIHHWTSYAFAPRDRRVVREQLGLPSDKKILLNVSLDVERKNTDLLPKLVESLDDSFLVLRIGDSRRIESRFRAGSFRWMPHVPPAAYPLYFNAADVLLMPSRAEGFGAPIIEALNSGIPVVASNLEVFREILGESYPYLEDPDDVAAWSAAVRAAWETAQSPARSQALYTGFRDYYRPERGRRDVLAFLADLD